MENPFNTEQNTAPKRSTLLTVFLVLTFIGSGFSFLFYAPLTLFFSSIMEFIKDYDEFAVLVPLIEPIGLWGAALLAILYTCSLVGAVMMWKLNKKGFHLYACAQIIILLTPVILGTSSFPTIFSTLVAALFIFVYARELKIFAKPVEENVQE